MLSPDGADQAYQQVWLELRRPYAGSTFPEWLFKMGDTPTVEKLEEQVLSAPTLSGGLSGGERT